MSKKMLKRSLTLGVMMAFVITGNAWAESNFTLPSNGNFTASGLNEKEFSFINSTYIFPSMENVTSSVSSNSVGMSGDISYTGSLIIYAGLSQGKSDGITIKDCHFLIDDNIKTQGSLELAGGANIFTGGQKKNERIVSNNSLTVRDAVLVSKNSVIEIYSGFANENALNTLVIDNETTVVGNSKFEAGSNVIISGGYARAGNANRNKVLISLDANVPLTDRAIIYGGYSGYNANDVGETGYIGKIEGGIIKGNADGNTVTIKGNSIVAGKVYGGYSEHGDANDNTINLQDNADVSQASLYGCNNTTGQDNNNTLNIGWDFDKEQASAWSGKVGSAQNFDVINVNEGSDVTFVTALNDYGTTVNLDSATWNITPEEDGDFQTNKVGFLNSNDGRIVFHNNGHLDVDGINVNAIGNGDVVITEAGKTADDLNTVSQLTTVAAKMGVSKSAKESAKAKVVMEAGEVVGKTTGIVAFETKGSGDDAYYHGVVTKVTEEINPANEAISDTGVSMKLHWRAHVDDMNKRMGELRDANGEYGVWTRMVRGESEYKNTKAQYNQYQLGYDEKLSVDKRWTVGAAVTFSDGKASYGYGSTEDKSTAFAIYGSKLNNDGTFVDLIARYANLESDVEDQAGKGSYSANGMSVSAEVGKRIQQDNGLWIEPQVQLTYGTVDSAEYKIGTKTVEVGDMNSLIGRVGFRIGKDIEKGNVYARASYLYDFEGETQNAFRNDTARRTFAEDLGGGWWEVGVGANFNLSKATYIYADVEKTFGGEVDTNWQWNLGVRYSF